MMKYPLTCVVVIISLLFCMCIGESEDIVRQKLDVVLKDDLEAIIEGISPDGLLEKPYYEIVLYNSYKEGSYSRLVVVDFFLFKALNMKITRKYRYYRTLGMWDRYYNKYKLISPETDEIKD